MVVARKSSTNQCPEGIGSRIISVLMILLVMLVPWVAAAESVDLTAMSLEELMEIEITSVARTPQKLSDTAAAAFIITAEDIRRSGATTIMDALRMAPGVQVAQIDGSKWAITARGLNGRFATQLLVLIDGRIIYSSFLAGVMWEDQDIMLEDIDHIEVIRGPGGSVWGANAVNGIINIITKNAADTQGTLITGGGGSHERAFGAVRHGGKLGETGHYRLFARTADRSAFDEASGQGGNNDWQNAMAGFRADGVFYDDDAWSLHGNVQAGSAGQSYIMPTLEAPYQEVVSTDSDCLGAYLLGRWSHRLSATSETALQLYYVHESYDDISTDVQEDTMDLDFQHHFALGGRQKITWGLGYRFNWTDTEEGIRFYYEPDSAIDHLFSAFIQDEIMVAADAVWLTLGSKVEHNYTGLEIQPSARIRWNVDETNTLWGAVSRAVRTQSRSESTTVFRVHVVPPDPPTMPYPLDVYLVGTEDMESESVWAYEVGYRTILNPTVSMDLAAFYNQYDNQAILELADYNFQTDPVPHYFVNLGWCNDMDGYSYGLEAAVDVFPQPWWKLRMAYTWLNITLEAGEASMVSEMAAKAENSSDHQVSLFSKMQLPYDVQLDAWLRYVGDIDAHHVPAYTTLDLRLAWCPTKQLELSLVGRNLLDPCHMEFRENYMDTVATEVERSVYGKLTWTF